MGIDPGSLPSGVIASIEQYNCLAGIVCATLLWWFWGKT